MSTPVITPIQPYDPGLYPLPQVTPFTFRDGATFLERFERLCYYINNTVLPTINSQVNDLSEEFITEVNALIQSVNDSITADQALVDQKVSDLTTYVNNQVATIIGSSVSVQDPVVQGIINNVSSLSRLALDALYAPISEVADRTTAVTNESNARKTSMLQMVGINVRDYGAVGDGVTDDTAAIQAACDAGSPGQRIIFPATGSGAFYKITNTINVTVDHQTWHGEPRDGYAVAIRTGVDSINMVHVTVAGWALINLGIMGKLTNDPSFGNGASCTATGVMLDGDIDGNMDAAIRGATFQYLNIGAQISGRNAEFSGNTIFSNCREGVKHDGKQSWQTGANASQNRGNTIIGCRFHNIGVVNTDNAIDFTANAIVLHMLVAFNYFDSNGLGAHISVVGASANTARGVTIMGNKHTEASAEAVKLTYCDYPHLTDFDFIGNTATGPSSSAIVINNCTYPLITNGMLRYVWRHGITGQNNQNVQISNVKMVQIGQHATLHGDALNFDNTNINVSVSNVIATTVGGAFFNGSPTGPDSTLKDCSYASTASGIISTTVMHRGMRGQNTYVEGNYGRVEDIGYGQYQLAATTPRQLVVVTAGGNFGTFTLEVEISGRDSSTGQAFFVGRRYVRVENGSPVFTTVGTDGNAGLTVTFAASGTNGISVTVQSATAMAIGARVRASAGGGPAASSSQAVTVTMLAQP